MYQAIATGESGELQNTSTIVPSSHSPERQAEAEGIVVGVTKINKQFDNQEQFEGTVTIYLPKEKWYEVRYDDVDAETLTLAELFR